MINSNSQTIEDIIEYLNQVYKNKPIKEHQFVNLPFYTFKIEEILTAFKKLKHDFKCVYSS